MGVRSRILAVADHILESAAEMLKAWLREVFRLCQQLGTHGRLQACSVARDSTRRARGVQLTAPCPHTRQCWPFLRC